MKEAARLRRPPWSYLLSFITRSISYSASLIASARLSGVTPDLFLASPNLTSHFHPVPPAICTTVYSTPLCSIVILREDNACGGSVAALKVGHKIKVGTEIKPRPLLVANRGWKRSFDEPIPLPRGRQLVTLEDAGIYITKAASNHRGGDLMQVGPIGPSCGTQYHPFKSFAAPFPTFFAAAAPNAPAIPDAGLASA
jgi:hypothetical protein